MIWAPWGAETWGPMVTGMIAGGSQAAANGGNLLMGMAFGAITGSVAMGGAGWESTLMSGLVGGTISTMMGGKFGYGFVAGSVGTMIGGQVGNPVGRVIASAALGGTITELTGGKFKNGAASAAFAAMIGEVGRKGIENRHSSSAHAKNQKTIDGKPAEGKNDFSKKNVQIIESRLSLARKGLVGKSGGDPKASAALLSDHDVLVSISDEYHIEVGARIASDGTILDIKTDYHHSKIWSLSTGTGSRVSVWHTHPGPTHRSVFGMQEDLRGFSGSDQYKAESAKAWSFIRNSDNSLWGYDGNTLTRHEYNWGSKNWERTAQYK